MKKTLYLTILIIDLYLSQNIIKRKNFQLLGIASLLISSKYNEIFYPSIRDFIAKTDNAYTKKQLIEMEKKIIYFLNFEVLWPTANDFYNIISNNFNFNKNQSAPIRRINYGFLFVIL